MYIGILLHCVDTYMYKHYQHYNIIINNSKCIFSYKWKNSAYCIYMYIQT